MLEIAFLIRPIARRAESLALERARAVDQEGAGGDAGRGEPVVTGVALRGVLDPVEGAGSAGAGHAAARACKASRASRVRASTGILPVSSREIVD